MKYYSVDEALAMVDEPNRSLCRHIVADNEDLFYVVRGSTNNHQAWEGGYLDHVQDAMNVAIVLHETLGALRPLPFTLSDALLVVFLHDIEKPWSYERTESGEFRRVESLRSKSVMHAFREAKLVEYGIVLTSDQQNGMKYVEGELDDYTNKRRVMGPLAAFCHLCDVTSARLWFDNPSEVDDPWVGAKRSRYMEQQ